MKEKGFRQIFLTLLVASGVKIKIKSDVTIRYMRSTIQPVSLILFFCLVISSLCIQGQNTYSSEDELKKNALQFFREGQYSEAVPLYSQLLSLYPGHAEYNFRYGACLIFTEPDKQKALKYLEYGAKDATEFPEINYFLGRAYHLNYRFSEAEKNYKLFLNNAPGKLLSVYPCSRDLEMAASGKKLTRSFSELKVVDKKLVNRSDFFRSYDLGDFGGRILVKPEEFMMSQDKKREDNSLIFYPDNAEQVYFSSYGDNQKNGKDIYIIKKLPTGEWDKPFPLPGPVNSPYDEDFPFLHPNGNILYFCSKGHNSMGGFDVFKSEFNERTQTWSQPVNMEFPLNSPGDELLFITDATGEKACFASSRSSFGEKIHIYQIQNTKESTDNILLAGNFIKPEAVSGDLDATITVVSNQSQLRSGVFRPNSQSGDYLLNLPGPGSYRFTVEVEGLPAQSGVVEIPDMANSRPLRQQMELVTSNGSTRLLIRNLFDEEVSEEQLAAALEDYVKKTSLLEVNYINTQPNDFTTDNISDESRNINRNPETSQTASQLSEEDLILLAKEGVEELKSEARELKEEADYSYQFAGERTNESRQKKSEADKLEASAISEEDPEVKDEMLSKAAALRKESETAARDALLAYNLALKIEEQAKSKETEALENEQYAKELETAINTKNEARAIELLEEQRKRIENQSSEDDEPDGIVNVLTKKRQSKLKEASDYRAKESQQKEEVLALMDEMDRMRSEASQTKDQDLQEQILSTVTDLEVEKKALEEQVRSLGKTAESLEKEAENLEQDIQLVQKISESRSDDSQIALTEEEKISIKTQVLEPTNTNLELSDNNSGNEEVLNSENRSSSELTTTENTASLEELYRNPASIVDDNGKVISYSEVYQSGLDTATVTKKQLLEAWQISIQEELKLIEKGAANDEVSLAYQENLEQKVKELENNLQALESPASTQGELNNPALEVLTDENSSTEFPESNYAQKNRASFKSEVAVKNAEKASELETEYNKLNDEYYSARQEADAATDEETKSQYNLQAEKVKTELNEKLAKRDSLMSVATRAEFSDSDLKITRVLSSESLTEESREQVAINHDEANRIFSEAAELRGQAEGETQPEIKKARLQEVSELEMTALEKQKTVLDILERSDYKPETPTADANTTDGNIENLVGSEGENLNAISSNSETGGIRDDESVISENIDDPSESEQNVSVSESSTLQLSPEKQRLIEVRNASYSRADSLSKVAQLHRSRQDSLRLVLESVSGKRKKEEIQTQIDLAATEEEWHMNESKSQRENGNKIQADLLAMDSTPEPGIENNSQVETESQTDPLLQSRNQSTPTDPLLNEVTGKALLDYTSYMEESESFGNKAVADSLLSALKYNEATTYENQLNSLMSEGRPEDDEEVIRTVELLTVTITAGDSLANSSRENRLISLQKAEEARNVLTPLGQDDQQLVISQYRNPRGSNSITSGQTTAQNQLEGNEGEIENSIEDNVTANVPENRIASTESLTEADNLNPENVNFKNNVSVVTTIPQELVSKEIYPDLAVSSKLEKEYFVKTEEAVYNESTPIPIDAPMPEGLVFKVQVGAFRKPIPQDLFKEFVPVNGERTTQGFTRYTVGYFRNLETARVAKDVIRGNGYPDAFVVAFLNGKRISNQQALQMVEGGGDMIGSNTTYNTNSSNTLNSSAQVGNVNSSMPGVENSGNTGSAIPIEEGVMEINQVNGILFTVQVGVFSKPVSNSPINDLQPLYREITPNGYYRYTSGIYPNAGRAQMAKADLNNAGISDAFVTAYLNGRRISVAEASRMLESGEAVIAVSGNNPAVIQSSENSQNSIAEEEVNPTNLIQSENPTEEEVNNRTSETVNQIGKTPESVKPVEVTDDVSSLNASEEVERVVIFPSGLLYVVQIGAFLDRVPNEEAAKFLKIIDKGINHYRKRNGFTVYSAGQFSEYDKASALRDELVNRFNLPDAFIVPYYNGYRIEIEKARDLELNNVND